MNKLMRLMSLITLSLIMVLGFQNCNKVQMQSVETQPADSGNGGLGAGDGGGNATPPPNQDTDENWIALNCKEDELRKTPIALNFTAGGGSQTFQQKKQESLSITDLKDLSVQQVLVKNLNISKTENLQIQQVAAKNISIEALQISKIQSIIVGEMKVRANRISAAFQQIASYEIFRGPRLLLQAIEADTIQQVSALCVRSNRVGKIQQIGYAKIIGDGSDAIVGDIQQLFILKVVDADVDIIQQVGLVVLKNAHVKKVHQVGKLILINSSVDEISEVKTVEQQ